MTDPLLNLGTRRRATSQKQPATAGQVQNSAGGFVFAVSPWTQLRRFLTLGVAGGTYYVGQNDLAIENARVVEDLVKLDGQQVVREVVAISTAGRAPRQQPALFALAVAASRGDVDTRRAALEALPLVARTATARFTFVTYAQQFRGWGRALKRGVANLYLTPSVEDVAYQVVKYRQRDGWTHRDVLRLAHPKPATDDVARRALFDWITHGEASELASWTDVDPELRLVEGFQRAQAATTPAQWARLVGEYGLTWEMLPTEALNDASVWTALLERGVPQTALMRQLPRLTNLGLLPGTGGSTSRVCAQLSDADRLTRARVHPINVLVAMRTYARGRGFRGNQTWRPTAQVVDALDAGFYAAFGAVRPTGQRFMLALDVSGSMACSAIDNMPLTPRDASAALALVTVNVESQYVIVGFTANSSFYGRQHGTALTPLAISPRQRLTDAVDAVSHLQFGGTDCSLPMQHALENSLEIDTFVVYTDNETWAGREHPFQALKRYRRESGIDARLVVNGMTATNFSIADPSDPGMLDVAGFDSATPNLISDFSRGLI